MLLSFRTEKDALIAELETAKSMSDEARRRAEEANLAKSRFLASMSHELRTPLNAILGFSEVMANEVLGPMGNQTYREYARDVHESGQHLLDLINEILDLSRIEAGRYQLNEEPLMLLHVVEDCCHLMELKARNKDIRIVQDFESTMPRLFADERAVRQITLNLLSNAIKFTSTGGEIRVRVGWTAGGGQYHLGARQRAGHSGRRNPDRAVGLRPGLDRHQERRAGHRPRPADRAGPACHAWRRVRASFQAARRHRGDRHLPAGPCHGAIAGNADRRHAARPAALSLRVIGPLPAPTSRGLHFAAEQAESGQVAVAQRRS